MNCNQLGIFFSLIFCLGNSLAADPPIVPDDISPNAKVLQPGIKLSLVVKHPDIVTPTGIDIDESGQIWTVASHTHFRPDPYDGPENDEVLIFDADGSNRRVFYQKTVATMDLELGPDGWVYLAERDRILRIKDSDGDNIADLEQDVAVLTTVADYPHNGLSGLTWDNQGNLIFSLGENFWKDWSLKGADGTTVKGTGEGGIFRCSPTGEKLHRIAKGFWNPFGVCVHTSGEIFAAENDPGSRPPCRMIHVVEGGDYGYNRRYGNAAFHPFVAWNGELRGTLPMLHPSGEAPCGILPLGGGVISGSWSDHRVDFYPLKRKGASFETKRVTLVKGSEHFRPTCFAHAPDGSIYFTDWALTFYHLHKRGRIWKLEFDSKLSSEWLQPAELEKPNQQAEMASKLRSGWDIKLDELLKICRDNRDYPFLAQAAILELSRRELPEEPNNPMNWDSPNDVISAILARRLVAPKDESFVGAALNHSDSSVQFEALRWIADEDLVSFREQVTEIFSRSDLNYQLFESALATINTLSGKSNQGVADIKMLSSRIEDEKAPGKIRAFALRLMPPDHGKLSPKLLRSLLQTEDSNLRLATCRVLSQRSDKESLPIVTKHLQQNSVSDTEASFLILRLAAEPEMHTALLKQFAGKANQLPDAASEAKRALRGIESYDHKPADPGLIMNPEALLDAIEALPGKPDLESGERLFFHPRYARCASCHQHSGRGKIVGPNLSAVGQRGDRKWLVESIVQPQKEVPAQYHPRAVKMKDGSTFTGFLLRNGGRSGKEFYRDITGGEVGLLKVDIENRSELEISLMPPGLLIGLSVEEIRDLMFFLERGSN